MSRSHRLLLCGEFARLIGVSPDTIRHYEHLGVLPKAPRSASGYRMYDPTALERVHLARCAMKLGFTLPELAEILNVRDSGGAPLARAGFD